MRLRLYKVTGHSMLPALADGDFVLAFRCARQALEAGDRVVVDHPEFGRIIKRVDRILPGGDLNISGDNPAMSTHSERLGQIPRERVAGKVLMVIRGPGLSRLNTVMNGAPAAERVTTQCPQDTNASGSVRP
ncbi:hypothetical protein RE428_11880 [Marinobacter nanhaiticus D15-8W]|uniref:Peptidase S24/S26A/S26B/S26C domain-containing protein n=1 Tax=Marinobacter nanhaiticus D15-8W TaxID=626887 RepID=N6WMW4_9GAMM|nr:S24 family peptidase [Marinobacter nanhaiticus]ENO12821.1 hypothetical protein J057_15525 [Marinobacter nanhaiticus D15-8W]BES70170.1 hypothetical protein RE428_11880 [Marinobacter nanhaiticus D15-8W]